LQAEPEGPAAALRSLVYLGTPKVAVTPLRALVEAGHDVRLVVTRPDRRRRRGAAPCASPVKEEAEALGIPVAYDVDAVLGAGAELGVVVAYGRIIPSRVLERLPMVNLHFSLLPRWRGAAPVERAILAGDEVTGVCVMALEPELDTGPIYAREVVAIAPGEHLGPLRDRLVAVGTRLLVEVLSGPLPEPEPQRGEPTYADKLDAETLRLTWKRPADELARVVRLDRAWTTWRTRRLLVLDAEPVATEPVATRGAGAGGAGAGMLAPGTLSGDAVVTGEGLLRLRRVQPEGRAPMKATDWLRGARPLSGERLGGP
jgi:methionyl-tRNA formyltransferase